LHDFRIVVRCFGRAPVHQKDGQLAQSCPPSRDEHRIVAYKRDPVARQSGQRLPGDWVWVQPERREERHVVPIAQRRTVAADGKVTIWTAQSCADQVNCQTRFLNVEHCYPS
jgi:hypothetical protein